MAGREKPEITIEIFVQIQPSALGTRSLGWDFVCRDPDHAEKIAKMWNSSPQTMLALRSGQLLSGRIAFSAGIRDRRHTLQLTDALLLFKKLGVDVTVLSERELTLAYFGLAKRYHPDHSKRRNQELMAAINAARTIIRKAHFYRE